MASESKKSFSPMLIYCNGIIFHLGFKDSGFSPPLIHLGNIKNVDFCPICPPPYPKQGILVWWSSFGGFSICISFFRYPTTVQVLAVFLLRIAQMTSSQMSGPIGPPKLQVLVLVQSSLLRHSFDDSIYVFKHPRTKFRHFFVDFA